MSEAKNKQVKSKQRVADHGEVFTAEREVNAMLDLVKQETERIDSTFLEPACGNGNFLAEILRRKLAAADQYKKFPADWEKNSVLAVMSIYGVDLLPDNVEECRERLYGIWEVHYTAVCKKECREACKAAVRYVLQRNILCGDALTLKAADGQPIIFSEWSMVGQRTVKRRDFRLDVLMNEHDDPNAYDSNNMQLSMFGEDTSGFDNWMTDPLTGQPTPAPIAEYEPIDYWRIQEHGA